MRALWPRVLNQGASNSCVGHAIAAAVGIVEHRVLGMGHEHPSPYMAYYTARAKMVARIGGSITDEGAFIRDGIAGFVQFGCANASEWPTKVLRVNKQPPFGTYISGHSRRGGRYYRITSFGAERIIDVKRALASGYPVVFGTMIGKSFLADDGGRTIGVPSPLDPIVGGHAMCAIGYSADGIEVANSWGSGWRDKGFAWLTEAYMTWFQTMDLWVVRDWQAVQVS